MSFPMLMPAEPAPFPVTRPSSPPPLRVHGPTSPERAAVETFVRDVYRTRYGADVRSFAPVLVSLHDHDGSRVAVAGYRPAGDGPLFLERYLGAPVERLLGGTARTGIVEVGHLAAVRAGAGRRLVMLLGPHLAAQGYDWVVGTLTAELRHLFLRLGIAPRALNVADPTLLGAEAAHWGSYYDHEPLVLAGAIQPALRLLARRGAAL